MTSEKELISLEYLQKLIGVVSSVMNFSENVEYVELIQCCWKFVYAACKRYPEWKLLLTQPSVNLSGSRLWMEKAILEFVIRGATIANSEIRSRFRSLVYSILPDGLFQRLALVFSYLTTERWQNQVQFGESLQWLPWFVDILLSSLVETDLVQLEASMHRFPALPLQFTSMDLDLGMDLEPPSDAPSSTSPLKRLVPLLRRSASLSMRDLVENLIELAYGDTRLAYRYGFFFLTPTQALGRSLPPRLEILLLRAADRADALHGEVHELRQPPENDHPRLGGAGLQLQAVGLHLHAALLPASQVALRRHQHDARIAGSAGGNHAVRAAAAHSPHSAAASHALLRLRTAGIGAFGAPAAGLRFGEGEAVLHDVSGECLRRDAVPL